MKEDLEAKQMYKENILENYKNPLNYGSLKNATNKSRAYNESCGDEIKIEIEIQNKKIKDVKFSGKACAICTASASLLTEEIKEKKIDEILKLKKEDVTKLLGIEISPVRIKCALLPLEAIQKALQ